MKRIDLPEIADLPGCPGWLRDAMTGYLETVIRLARPYVSTAPILAGLLRESGLHRVLDLASGGGGPWPALVGPLAREAGRDMTVTLSDLRPNVAAARRLERVRGLTYRREPVSALDASPPADAALTLFTGLHHFDRDEVAAILRAAQRAGVQFLAAEATHRSLRGVIVTLFIPVFVLLLMPLVRPRRALPLLLTYLPPVLPFLIWWDGFASTLRTYRAAELEAIFAETGEPGYAWKAEEIEVAGAPIPVTVVVGRPVAAVTPGQATAPRAGERPG